MTTKETSAAPDQGAVHDLAYRRYDGARRPSAYTPLVIARYALELQLRQRGVKIALVLGLLILAVTAAVLGGIGYMSQSASAITHGGRGASSLTEVDGYALSAIFGATALPVLLLMVLCAAPAVAADLTAGAFQFHFARPLTARQYLVGRLLSATGWSAALMLLAWAVLVGERAAFGTSATTVFVLYGKGLLGVALRLLSLASVALGVSSLTRRKGLAQATFASVVLGTFILSVALAAGLDREWLLAIDVLGCAPHLTAQLAGETALHGAAAWAPGLACAFWTAPFLALAWWRVSRAEVVRG